MKCKCCLNCFAGPRADPYNTNIYLPQLRMCSNKETTGARACSRCENSVKLSTQSEELQVLYADWGFIVMNNPRVIEIEHHPLFAPFNTN